MSFFRRLRTSLSSSADAATECLDLFALTCERDALRASLAVRHLAADARDTVSMANADHFGRYLAGEIDQEEAEAAVDEAYIEAFVANLMALPYEFTARQKAIEHAIARSDHFRSWARPHLEANPNLSMNTVFGIYVSEFRASEPLCEELVSLFDTV